MVKLEVPAAVGVPLMTPVEAARLSPAGKVPVETVHELLPQPVCARVCE